MERRKDISVNIPIYSMANTLVNYQEQHDLMIYSKIQKSTEVVLENKKEWDELKVCLNKL